RTDDASTAVALSSGICLDAGDGEVQVVPLAAATGRRRGMLRPPRRAADGRHDRIRSRGLVPGLHVLQAAPYPEKTIARRIPLLAVRLRPKANTTDSRTRARQPDREDRGGPRRRNRDRGRRPPVTQPRRPPPGTTRTALQPRHASIRSVCREMAVNAANAANVFYSRHNRIDLGRQRVTGQSHAAVLDDHRDRTRMRRHATQLRTHAFADRPVVGAIAAEL